MVSNMDDYSARTVPMLREELKRRSIPTTGLTRKAQMVETLEHSDKTAGSSAEVQEADVEATGDEALGQTADTAAPETKDDKDEEPAAPEAEETAATTPKAGSPAAEDTSSESRKRKRESQSTPERAGLADPKKLKFGEQPGVEAKVAIIEDAGIKVDESVDQILEEKPVNVASEVIWAQKDLDNVGKSLSEREDTAPSKQEVKIGKEADAVNAAEQVVSITTHNHDVAVKIQRPEEDKLIWDDEQSQTKENETAPTATEITEMADAEMAGAPAPIAPIATHPPPDSTAPTSVHPPTRALYISNLTRPLQEQQLRDHLAIINGGPPDDDRIESLYLNALRTHAFVVLPSEDQATLIRRTLHNQSWPESSRKPLWVDFVPPTDVPTWIEAEKTAEAESSNKREHKRWEIAYEPAAHDTDVVTAVHREKPSATATGQGMPNAPLGPRGSRPPVPAPTPNDASDTTTTSAPAASGDPVVPPTDHLDALFTSTTAKPKIYFKPVSPTLKAARLKELETETSRDWVRSRGAEVGGPLDQVRRYTFEDGSRVVDGGPDFGNFGRSGGGGGGAGYESYAPRGRRGGFGGGRGRR